MNRGAPSTLRPGGLVAPRDLLSHGDLAGSLVVASGFWAHGNHKLHMAASRRAFVRACAHYVPAIKTMASTPS